jgi:hypothetical protein
MISVKGTLNKEEFRQYLINTLKFTAPGLAVFFGQLALGIDWKAAALTASLVFYGNLADFFTKLNQGK